ncbi:MAG TPA: DMT family transporter [Nitrososphaera sp.]|nr:DMT family transporter [Nitrososphaera sp.]
MIRLSWVVFVYAVLLSAESIVIELLTTRLALSPLVIAGNSIMIAGAALLAVSASTNKQETISIFRAWKYLVPASVLIAIGVYFWYDSVTNVGASKEGLLSGPLEVVVILILARLLLSERLGRVQSVGAIIALLGFFAAVLSAGSVELLLTWGDAEAVLSAVSFGTGIIFVTKLTKKHSALQVTGASLFISGLVLAAILWTSSPTIDASDWTILLAFSILPLAAALTYVNGLARIGASMTSVIGSFSILLTMFFQLGLLIFDINVILPSNIPLAALGGSLGIIGIYLIHRKGN